MKKQYSTGILIPEGISCEFIDRTLVCKKGDTELKRIFIIPGVKISVEDGKVNFNCLRANKKDIALMNTNRAHAKNMLNGVENNFVYELEICNVHFPMTVKVDKNKVIISNFLGEKVNRTAKIAENVNVEVKGNKIFVTGGDIERTGQTAANIEKASKVAKKDRRVFQDGIFLINKPRRAI
ncbi:MAG: 50S ribosomal protein L6 [Candidatus Pacearchaeota archaeon]|nr:50S ribosomal protein L6 [Candidatus Pacearchaeota archaeon]